MRETAFRKARDLRMIRRSRALCSRIEEGHLLAAMECCCKCMSPLVLRTRGLFLGHERADTVIRNRSFSSARPTFARGAKVRSKVQSFPPRCGKLMLPRSDAARTFLFYLEVLRKQNLRGRKRMTLKILLYAPGPPGCHSLPRPFKSLCFSHPAGGFPADSLYYTITHPFCQHNFQNIFTALR